jgi:transcriptional regulator with XRE-family HTH domain
VIKINFYKKYHTMNGIKIIRNHFGLTQQNLAIFLEISTSMLAMAETGKRLLPTHALVKLSLLDAQLQPTKKKEHSRAITAQLKKQTAPYTKQMQALYTQIQYAVAGYKKKYDLMQKRQQQATQALALAQVLQQNNTKTIASKKDMAWLQLVEKKAFVDLKNTHPLLQAHTQIKLKLLQQEAAAVQKLLKKLA